MPTPIPGTMMTTADVFALRPQYTGGPSYKPIMETQQDETDSVAEEYGACSDAMSHSKPSGDSCDCCGTQRKMDYQRSKSVDPDFKFSVKAKCKDCTLKDLELLKDWQKDKHDQHGDIDNAVTKDVCTKAVCVTETQKTLSFDTTDSWKVQVQTDGDELEKLQPTNTCAGEDDDVESCLPSEGSKFLRKQKKCERRNRCYKIIFAVVVIAVGLGVGLGVGHALKEKQPAPTAAPTRQAELPGRFAGAVTNVTSIQTTTEKGCQSLFMICDNQLFAKDPDNNSNEYVLPWRYSQGSDRNGSLFRLSTDKRSITVTKPGWYSLKTTVHIDSITKIGHTELGDSFHAQICIIVSGETPACKKLVIGSKMVIPVEVSKRSELQENQEIRVALTLSHRNIIHDITRFEIMSLDCR